MVIFQINPCSQLQVVFHIDTVILSSCGQVQQIISCHSGCGLVDIARNIIDTHPQPWRPITWRSVSTRPYGALGARPRVDTDAGARAGDIRGGVFLNWKYPIPSHQAQPSPAEPFSPMADLVSIGVFGSMQGDVWTDLSTEMLSRVQGGTRLSPWPP